MRHFGLIRSGLDISAAIVQIDGQPELWNQRQDRRDSPASPHRETSDIWVRYRRPEEISRPTHFEEPHESVFWPAWHALPALEPLVRAVTDVVDATALGGILITRIPPRGRVYPHSDKGSWHADHYDLKVWMPLRANARCVNYCADEQVIMRPGDAWTFDNAKVHSVANDGETERVCLIICMRGA